MQAILDLLPAKDRMAFERAAAATEALASLPAAAISTKLWNAMRTPYAKMPIKLYQVRCAQVVDDFVRTGAVPKVTAADMLFCLSEVSLRAPLHREAALLYRRLFEECLPEDAAEDAEIWKNERFSSPHVEEELREDLHQACLQAYTRR